MKTQISSLISGTQFIAGSSRAQRALIGEKLLSENGDKLRIEVKGIILELTIGRSLSGKSWWWTTELTSEQYAIITNNCPLGISNKINNFTLTISDDCRVTACVTHRESERHKWKLGCKHSILEKNIIIL